MTDTPKTIEEKFTESLSELIGICLEGGMYPPATIEPIEKELRWIGATMIDTDKT